MGLTGSKIRPDVVVYAPDRTLRMGLFEGWREMFLTLFYSRGLIGRLFLRDFSARYRQSLFGIAWAVLNPLAVVGAFVFMNRSGILHIEETNVPYPVFALIGLSIFGFFSTGLSAGANSIIDAGPMVVKVNFPKISLVIASLGQALVEFAVRLCFLAAVFIIFGVVPRWGTILFPFALVPILLLTLGLGLILALVGGIFRDTQHVASLGTTFLLFLTPVLYPAPEEGLFAALNIWNPLSHLITGGRELILAGRMGNPGGFLWASLFSLGVFLIAWKVFYLAETKIAERV